MPRVASIDVTFRAKPGGHTMDTAAANAVARGPGVRSDLRRRARNVQAAAKALVGVRTGRLKSSIRVSEGGNTIGSAASVAVIAGRPGIPYTWLHHEGAAPHKITAHGNALSFVSNGQLMVRKSVNHPGSRGTQFLLRATPRWVP